MTPALATGDLEQRLRQAMEARVTPDRLTHVLPPAPARQWFRWQVAVGAVAASIVGVLAVTALDRGDGEGYSVATGGALALAGVGYDLPAGWTAVEVPAAGGLRRTCLTPASAPQPADDTCRAVELMVTDPVKDPATAVH